MRQGGMESGVSEDQYLRDQALPRGSLWAGSIDAIGHVRNPGLAEQSGRKYSQSVVRHCYSNIRSITHMAKKMNFLTSDPAEDVTMPQTKPVEKPQMTQKQILALIGGIQDLHDLCLMYIGIFCGPRASEVLGLQWKSWTGATLVPHGTAFEGQFYPGRFKTRSSRAPIGVPEQVRPIIEAWKQACCRSLTGGIDVSDFRRGERTGQAVPRWGKNFLRWRVRPIAQKLGIPTTSSLFR
jgi:integrase